MIGLDTSAIINLFEGYDNIKQFLLDNKEPLAVTIASYLELFFGLNPANPKHLEEGKYYEEFFKALYNIDLNKGSCQEDSRIFWKLKKEGRKIDQFDCLIASVFLTNGISKILAGNQKHFERIKQLNIITY